MKLTVVLNGRLLDLDVKYAYYEKETLDVSRVGELFARRRVARGTRMELEAVANDGTVVDGFFRIVGRRHDGTLEIEPWSGLDRVGGSRT